MWSFIIVIAIPWTPLDREEIILEMLLHYVASIVIIAYGQNVPAINTLISTSNAFRVGFKRVNKMNSEWNRSRLTVPIERNPCSPSPCGPNSRCRVTNGQAVCSCLPEYVGSPPGCRPECVVSSECPSDKACVNQKCTEPCPGQCGTNTDCRVMNHSPICACKLDFTGDPFTRCFPTPSKKNFVDGLIVQVLC